MIGDDWAVSLVNRIVPLVPNPNPLPSMAFAMAKAVAIRRSPVMVGPQEIVGMEGVARAGGYVFVRGELWRARAADKIIPGEHVQVDGLDGLTLDVHRIDT